MSSNLANGKCLVDHVLHEDIHHVCGGDNVIPHQQWQHLKGQLMELPVSETPILDMILQNIEVTNVP